MDLPAFYFSKSTHTRIRDLVPLWGRIRTKGNEDKDGKEKDEKGRPTKNSRARRSSGAAVEKRNCPSVWDVRDWNSLVVEAFVDRIDFLGVFLHGTPGIERLIQVR